MKPNMLGLETDERGLGSWSFRKSTPEGAEIELTFAYSDGSVTTKSFFKTRAALPGTAPTEAGSFILTGDEKGGEAMFEGNAEFIKALRAFGQRVFEREMVACGISQIPLAYVTNVLERWPSEKIMTILGMYMFGVTEEDIVSAIAEKPDIAATDVISLKMMRGWGKS